MQAVSRWSTLGTPSWALLLALAGLFTLLNALKPVHMDDTAYYYYARRIAEHPLDPYGFEVFWGQWPLRANRVLAPPVLPYWWSVGFRLFSERPFLWKLWLFPFSLLFVFSLHAIFRRFAAGLEMLLVWMTVLSPTFLPSLNLMLDIPALALGLCAFWIFLSASDRNSVRLSVFAGLVAGLAMQTKYTGVLIPAVMLLYGIFFGRVKLALIAASVAAAVFISWEVYTHLLYGRSHFLNGLDGARGGSGTIAVLFTTFFSILGGIAPALGLLALAALCVGRRVIVASALLVALGYLLLIAVPEGIASGMTSGHSVDQVIFPIFGYTVCALVMAVVWALGTSGRPDQWSFLGRHWDRVDCFLLGWLLLELAGYCALNPFPAVRRFMGVIVITTLLIGRLAARKNLLPSQSPVICGAAVVGILLGLGFYVVDLREAQAIKQSVVMAADYVKSQDPKATIWYAGRWGFQYYAERAGMVAVVPASQRSLSDGSLPVPSSLKKGDWLVVPDGNIDKQVFRLEHAESIARLAVEDLLPLRTLYCYYSGPTALEHRTGSRRSVTILRITEDFVPVSTRLPMSATRGKK
jgi:hypothetical protein